MIEFRRNVAAIAVSLLALSLVLAAGIILETNGSQVRLKNDLWGVLFMLLPLLAWFLVAMVVKRGQSEPVGLILRSIFFSMVATSGVLVPLFSLTNYSQLLMDADLLNQSLAAFLTGGLSSVAVLWLSLRYAVQGEDAFDRYDDGLVYGAAAGIGQAVVLNMVALSGSMEMTALGGSVWMITSALVSVSVGMLLGLLMAIRKQAYLGTLKGLGLMLLAAFLYAVLIIVSNAWSRIGLGYHPLIALAILFVLCLGGLAAMAWVARRLSRRMEANA